MTGDSGYLSAVAQLAALGRGQTSSEALVHHALARIEALDADLRAIISLDAGAALAAARRADAQRRAGALSGPLHGLVLTIKDCFEVKGLPASNGVPALRDYRPSRTAAAVQRLVDAGAIILAKTSVPAHSLDLQTFNDLIGTTVNPWDHARSPGGSSGGAAVALASGITPLEMGTDLAGSLRIPAHATGVCALKPSDGVIPASGILGAGAVAPRRHPDLLVAGPMARSIGDLRLALDVLAGPAGRKTPGWRLELPAAPAAARRLRVAAWLDDPLCPVEEEVAGVLADTVAVLREMGMVVDGQARPVLDPGQQFRDFFQLMYGEMGGEMAAGRYRAFRRAASHADPKAEWSALDAMPAAVAQSHREWLQACERREQYRDAWDAFFGKHDVLLLPVLPFVAQPHDHRPFEQRSILLGGRQQAYMHQVFWCSLATMGGLPAVVLPVGLGKGGLPVGIQLVARHLGEHAALDLAQLLEKLCGGFRRPPRVATRR